MPFTKLERANIRVRIIGIRPNPRSRIRIQPDSRHLYFSLTCVNCLNYIPTILNIQVKAAVGS